jgi:protein phosphatase methylesterase 1
MLVLVGHSLGGSVAIRVAASKELNVAGIIVLDVVEGTAIPALPHMTTLLKRRPKYFRDIPEAIRWCVTSGTVKNIDSARVSIPDTLVFDENSNAFFWRTNLISSEPYWRGWYEGMNAAFLKLPFAKMLALAGVDRLDKEMIIAQMQGKLQIVIHESVGHTLHEDKPAKIAQDVIEFIERNQFSKIAALNAKWKR